MIDVKLTPGLQFLHERIIEGNHARAVLMDQVHELSQWREKVEKILTPKQQEQLKNSS